MSEKLIKLAEFMKENDIAFVVPAHEDRTINVVINGTNDETEQVFSYKEEFRFKEEFTSLDILGMGLL